MAKLNHSLALVGLLMLPISLYAAGFDCAKASSWAEKTICADPQLSDLDELLAASYKKALAGSSEAVSLKTAQKHWLGSVRDVCQNKECLKAAYTSRLAELNSAVANSVKPFAISGTYKRYYRGKLDTNSTNITLRDLGNGQVHVGGDSVWIGNAAIGNVNIGQLDGTFTLEGSTIHYKDDGDEACALTISVTPNGLNVSNDNMRCGGLNVTFDGQYRKVGKK